MLSNWIPISPSSEKKPSRVINARLNLRVKRERCRAAPSKAHSQNFVSDLIAKLAV